MTVVGATDERGDWPVSQLADRKPIRSHKRRKNLLASCNRVVQKLGERVTIWRAARALHRMNNRHLKDIGVSRCGIDCVVRHGRHSFERGIRQF